MSSPPSSVLALPPTWARNPSAPLHLCQVPSPHHDLLFWTLSKMQTRPSCNVYTSVLPGCPQTCPYPPATSLHHPLPPWWFKDLAWGTRPSSFCSVQGQSQCSYLCFMSELRGLSQALTLGPQHCVPRALSPRCAQYVSPTRLLLTSASPP